jgi:hypothetical protein
LRKTKEATNKKTVNIILFSMNEDFDNSKIKIKTVFFKEIN